MKSDDNLLNVSASESELVGDDTKSLRFGKTFTSEEHWEATLPSPPIAITTSPAVVVVNVVSVAASTQEQLEEGDIEMLASQETVGHLLKDLLLKLGKKLQEMLMLNFALRLPQKLK